MSEKILKIKGIADFGDVERKATSLFAKLKKGISGSAQPAESPATGTPQRPTSGGLVGGPNNGTPAANTSSSGVSSLLTGLLGLGAAIAGAVTIKAIMSARNANAAYTARIPSLLKMAGQGTEALTGAGRSSGIALGYDSNEVDSTQIGLNRSFGKVGAQAENNRTANTLAYSRALALDPDEISGAGNTLRATAGGDFASTQTANILSAAISEGMDRSQASNFLATMSQGISEMSRGGTANTNALLAFATRMSAAGKSPEQSLKAFSTVSNAVSGSSGNNNSFFQQAAARGGLGGGTLLGSQLAVKQGLLGMDLGSGKGGLLSQIQDPTLRAQTKNAFGGKGGLGDRDFTQKMSTGILEGIGGKGFDANNKEEFQGMVSSIMENFGVKDSAEAVKVLDTLTSLAKGGSATKEDSQRLRSLTQSPDQKMQEDLINTMKDLRTASVNAAASFAAVDLGKQVAPYFNKLTEANTKFEQSLSSLLGTDLGANLADGLSSIFAAPLEAMAFGIESISAYLEKLNNMSFVDVIGKIVGDFFTSLTAGLTYLITGAIDGLVSTVTGGMISTDLTSKAVEFFRPDSGMKINGKDFTEKELEDFKVKRVKNPETGKMEIDKSDVTQMSILNELRKMNSKFKVGGEKINKPQMIPAR